MIEPLNSKYSDGRLFGTNNNILLYRALELGYDLERLLTTGRILVYDQDHDYESEEHMHMHRKFLEVMIIKLKRLF